MPVKEIDRWVADRWGPVLGYTPIVYIICKGWYFFLYKSAEDTNRILNSVWIVKGGSLMLKRWHVAFNPEKELIRFRHLWVIIPGCPLAIWNREAFMEIGNTIGKFLYVDPGLLAGTDRRVGKFLAEVEIF
jgi:hypothetical protein